MTKKTEQRSWLFWLVIILAGLFFISLIRSILLPFVLGVLTAYFLDPATDRLEKSGLSRNLSTTIIIGGFFVTVILALVLIIPTIASQLSGLLAAIPGFAADFESKYAQQLWAGLGGIELVDMDKVKDATANVSGVFIRLLGNFVTQIMQSGMAIANLLSLILITPIVAFYLLRDWDRIMDKLDSYLPRAHASTIREQLTIIDNTLAGFIRGQLNVCLLLASFYAIGLSLVGLNFGILIGLCTGLLVIFPYVGMMLGMGIGLSVAFFQFDTIEPLFSVLAVFIAGQVIEGYFITPKLVGEKVGLHPVWIIFGLLAGAALFGFVGVLLAIPASAVIGVLIRFVLQRYLQSSYYQASTSKTKA